MKLQWTTEALRSLTLIEEYISDVAGQEFGQNLKKKLYKTPTTLLEFPLLGKAVPRWNDPQLREILDEPYRIIYQLDSVDRPTTIYIMGVIHSAQLLQNTPLVTLFDP